jgi:hypothetical protein
MEVGNLCNALTVNHYREEQGHADAFHMVEWSNARDQRRRAVGAPLADRYLWVPLALIASGVTTSAERCIA